MKKIFLFIEHSEMVQKVILRLSRVTEYDFKVTSSAEEAKEFMDSHGDRVLRMYVAGRTEGKINNWDFVKEIRDTFKGEIVAMSASCNKLLMAAGCDREINKVYLSKDIQN